jgi:hypothetical protein
MHTLLVRSAHRNQKRVHMQLVKMTTMEKKSLPYAGFEVFQDISLTLLIPT